MLGSTFKLCGKIKNISELKDGLKLSLFYGFGSKIVSEVAMEIPYQEALTTDIVARFWGNSFLQILLLFF